MKINFKLRFISKPNSSVTVSYNGESVNMTDGEVYDVERHLNIFPNRKNDVNHDVLNVSHLREGIGASLKIESLSVNSVDVDNREMQDFFVLGLSGNKYSKDGTIEKVSEICFNGVLKFMTGDIRRFFWSPFYASEKRNDFVYDNRLDSIDESLPQYLPVYKRLGEKVYSNKPHRALNRTKEYDFGCFGCSLTFGTGLDSKDVWPSLLSPNHLNLAVSSLGIDGIYLNLTNALNKFNWQKTVIVLPNWERKILRFRLPSGEVTRVPTTLSSEWAHSYFKNWAWTTFNRQLTDRDRTRWKKAYQKNFKYLVDGRIEQYSKKILSKIVDLCEQSGRTLYMTSWDHETYDSLDSFIRRDRILPFFEKIDEAGDEQHPGPASHKRWIELSRPFLIDQKKRHF